MLFTVLADKKVCLRNGQIFALDDTDIEEQVDVQIGDWWITTAENASRGQADWGDDDLWKTVDFTVAPYWIYSEDGEKWSPIKDQTELELFLKEG